MRLPEVGDRIFHLVAGLDSRNVRRRFLWGTSVVASECLVTGEPPVPGDWPARGEYYRIDLKDLRKAHSPVPLDEIEAGIADSILDDLGPSRPKYFLYSPHKEHFRITQGIYLTTLTSTLETAFDEALAA